MTFPTKYTAPVEYGDIRFDPDSGSPTYIGLHTKKGAATSDVNWKILKMMTSQTQTVYGAWDNRAGLF